MNDTLILIVLYVKRKNSQETKDHFVPSSEAAQEIIKTENVQRNGWFLRNNIYSISPIKEYSPFWVVVF